MPLNTKNGATRYTHKKVGRNKSYFTSDPLNGDNKYTANDICKMIEFLVDNIYVRFSGQLFRQMIGVPMGTNCAPLLADLFLYSYESEFLDKLVNKGKRKLARKFNLSYCYIDDLISFNNKRFNSFGTRCAFMRTRSPPPLFDEMRKFVPGNRHDCTMRCALECIFLLVNLNKNGWTIG